MIKAIFLDMGGVIVDLDFDACVRAFVEEAGFTNIRDFLDTCHHRGFISQFESGRIGFDEFFAECRRYSRPDVTDDELSSCFGRLLVGIPQDKIEYLRELSSRYPLFMLSNNNPVAMRFCRKIFSDAGLPMEEAFRDTFISCEMKMIKPDREIFDESVRRSGFRADEVLFIDDSMINVEAARAAGLKAAFFERGKNLRTVVEAALKDYDS